PGAAASLPPGCLPAPHELFRGAFARADRSGGRHLRTRRARAQGCRCGGMKLVLINPRNRTSLYGDYLWQPLAFGYVAAATPERWTVELIDEQCEPEVDYNA